jgi:hypothetical protein
MIRSKWVDLGLDKKLFKNLDENALTSTYGALENCYVTEAGGLSKFPGLVLLCDLGGAADQHLSNFNDDLISVGTDGRVFRIDFDGNFTQMPGVPVLGGGRTSFGRTRDGLMMAAGQQIVKFDGVKNTVLSKDAPLSAYVGYIDGYVVAVEKGSGRFQYSDLDVFSSWPGLNTFGVNSSPDDIGSMLITPFLEMLFSSANSIEQYERNIGGTVPFFRRWAVGTGVSEPDTLCFADNAIWGLNSQKQFVRIAGQAQQTISDDIQSEIEHRFSLEKLGDLHKSWATALYIKGQKFILFQSPNMTNVYGTKGFTGVFDIRRGSWFEVFGWNDQLGVPDLWPGRSIFSFYNKTLVGGQGKIYILDPTVNNNNGAVQRAYARTAHFDSFGTININKVRMTIDGGVGSYTKNPQIMFRSNPDHKGFGNMQVRDLGYTGQQSQIIEFGAQGIGTSWQFEWSVTDDCQFDLRRIQMDVAGVVR